MKTAMFWEKRDENVVTCKLCHHYCSIQPGERGFCGVRENRNGELVSLIYGRVVAASDDPIEKKPLYHVLPGTRSYSIATCGCNFRCLHCQNCRIAQPVAGANFDRTAEVPPARIVRNAFAAGCRSIAYTYTEPTIFFEYALDVARLATAQGLKNVFVTNGYTTPEALAAIAPYLDAANIDLKFMNDEAYRTICGAYLKPVLKMIREYRRLGIWIEVTTLIMPGLNDSEPDLHRIASFIAEVGLEIPWHVSAFYPTHQMLNRPPTSPSTLRKAREIGAAAGLYYVYTGNIADADGAQTRCPECQAVAIRRDATGRYSARVGDGKCPDCGRALDGVFH